MFINGNNGGEDFGAGILDTNGGGGESLDFSGDDPFMGQVRTLFSGLPEDGTPETFRDYVLELQEKADKATQLEEQNRAFQAQLAEQMQRQQSAQNNGLPNPGGGQPTPAEQNAAANIAEARAEAKRRYEAAQSVDPLLQPYLGSDFAQVDANGRYIPTEKFQYQPAVQQACNAMNAQLEYQRRILGDLTTDPYAFVNEGVTHSPVLAELRAELAAMRKQQDEQQKLFQERLSPLQQHQQEQALNAMVQDNHALLTMPKPGSPEERAWSPAGMMFNQLIQVDEATGKPRMDPAAALEMVKPLAGLTPPPPPKPKPQTRLSPPRLSARVAGHGGGAYGGVNRVPEMAGRGPREGQMPFRMRLEDLGPAIDIPDE